MAVNPTTRIDLVRIPIKCQDVTQSTLQRPKNESASRRSKLDEHDH